MWPESWPVAASVLALAVSSARVTNRNYILPPNTPPQHSEKQFEASTWNQIQCAYKMGGFCQWDNSVCTIIKLRLWIVFAAFCRVKEQPNQASRPKQTQGHFIANRRWHCDRVYWSTWCVCLTCVVSLHDVPVWKETRTLRSSSSLWCWFLNCSSRSKHSLELWA